jgi:hypothetical protein
MTSHPSPPRRSSGSSRAGLTLAALAAVAAAGEPLRETRGGVTIDWQAGTLSATGGAAADLSMPSVDLARPGATRRATAAAQAKLRGALGDLALGAAGKLSAGEIDRALGRARTADTQLQSNGGAVVRVEVRFGDWLDKPVPANPVATLAVPAMRLEAAPAARIGGRDGRIGAALYRLGAPPPEAHAVRARVDPKGRIEVPAEAGSEERLAHGGVVIYVQKVLR